MRSVLRRSRGLLHNALGSRIARKALLGKGEFKMDEIHWWLKGAFGAFAVVLIAFMVIAIVSRVAFGSERKEEIAKMADGDGSPHDGWALLSIDYPDDMRGKELPVGTRLEFDCGIFFIVGANENCERIAVWCTDPLIENPACLWNGEPIPAREGSGMFESDVLRSAIAEVESGVPVANRSAVEFYASVHGA